MNTPEDLRPDLLAKALEDRGFDSLFMGEHSHIPAARTTPYPSGGVLPAQYLRMMDPFVSLTMAAMATTTLQIGTGVALALEHDLLDLAKSAASLDVMSGGRLLFGVGVGWNVEELANHRAIPWRQRYRALEDCVSALRRVWCDNDAEYHGEFYDFDPLWSFPKPVQKPHPPVLLGVGGRVGTAHAVRWADEWMPIDIALGNVVKNVGKFRQAALDAGRDDIPISLVAYGDPTLQTLAGYRELGIRRVLIGTARAGWEDPTTVLAYLDQYAKMIPELA